MDVLLIVFGFILLLIGIVGCIIPALPGPPIAYFALILLLFHSNGEVHPNTTLLISYALAVIIITALDYFLPIWGTKRFGGTNAGKRGSIVGLIASFFVPIFVPFNIIIGPFVGAVVGELIAGNNSKTALNSGIGSFLGFMAGTLLKLGMVGLIIWKFVQYIWV